MRLSRTTIFLAMSVSLLALLVAACGGGSSSNSGGPTITVSLTENGCDPSAITANAGPVTFEVSNKSAAAVTEFEVKDGGKIIGEVENVAPGLTKKFNMNLKAGTFDIVCPGGKTPTGKLTVS